MADIELVIKLSEKTYKHIMSMQFYIPGARNGKSLLEEIIKAIRTGTPLPKGRWISHWERCKNLGVMPSGLSVYAWCSNCDSALDVGEWHRNHYNYCPNCGAKMVEPQESDG